MDLLKKAIDLPFSLLRYYSAPCSVMQGCFSATIDIPSDINAVLAHSVFLKLNATVHLSKNNTF